MAKDFYTEWLAIPAGVRPPDHYALLGVPRFCRDLDAVENATRARLTRLDEYAMHPDRATRDAVQDLMNAVARARVVLVNSRRCEAYDEELARKLGIPVPGAVEQQQQPGPRPATAEPESPIPPIEPFGPNESVRRFRRVVWAHLRRWRLNAHEERLLVAEAATFNIDAEQALEIIHRIEHQAEARARREIRHTTSTIAALGMTAVIIIVMVIAYIRWDRGEPQRLFDADISEARQCLSKGDPKGAEAHLDSAEKLFPEHRDVQILRDEVVAKREELGKRFRFLLAEAHGLVERGDPEGAWKMGMQARQISPADPDLAALLRELKLERLYRKQFLTELSMVRTMLSEGKLEPAERLLNQAALLYPDDPQVAALREELQRKRK